MRNTESHITKGIKLLVAVKWIKHRFRYHVKITYADSSIKYHVMNLSLFFFALVNWKWRGNFNVDEWVCFAIGMVCFFCGWVFFLCAVRGKSDFALDLMPDVSTIDTRLVTWPILSSWNPSKSGYFTSIMAATIVVNGSIYMRTAVSCLVSYNSL